MHMQMQWFSQHPLPFNLVVAYIPLLATVVTTILSLVLARATLRYAEASDKSLALAREEFERQWAPELHVKLEKVSSRKTNIMVTNLAEFPSYCRWCNCVRSRSQCRSLRSILNEPLVGGYHLDRRTGKAPVRLHRRRL